jgi:hypothetical protein
MPDFALRVGFEARPCQAYRAPQARGKAASGVKHVQGNMRPKPRRSAS